MEVNGSFTLISESGEEKKYDVLLTFDSDDEERSYVVYTDYSLDENGNTKVLASIYDYSENDNLELMPIESEDDWNTIRQILEILQETIDDGSFNSLCDEELAELVENRINNIC